VSEGVTTTAALCTVKLAERRDWRRGIKALTDEIARHDGVPFVLVEI
jgi:hypothetical protein